MLLRAQHRAFREYSPSAPVVDFAAPSSKAALKALQEGNTQEILLRYGRWFTGSEADAKDLLQEALLVVCDPGDGRPWDPARSRFMTHMRKVMHDLAHGERRIGYGRFVVLDPDAGDHVPTHAPRPDDALSDAEDTARLLRWGEVVYGRLDAFARSVYDLLCEGIDRPAEMAARLGCDVADITSALKRIAYHARRVRAEESLAELSRKPSPPGSATKKKDLPS